MPIVVNLDVMLARRKMRLTKLKEMTGVSLTNLSILHSNKSKAIRFSTLEAICAALECKPGDILDHMPQDEYTRLMKRK